MFSRLPAKQLIREAPCSTIDDYLQAAILGSPIGSYTIHDVSDSDSNYQAGKPVVAPTESMDLFQSRDQRLINNADLPWSKVAIYRFRHLHPSITHSRHSIAYIATTTTASSNTRTSSHNRP
jgi:hypothetical protein